MLSAKIQFVVVFCIVVQLAAATPAWVASTNNFEKSLVGRIQDDGYVVEVHKIYTEDDYILTVFRLPSKLKNPKIVYIMHGIESSASDYVIGGKGASLAYLFADNGYDVWLGNARGNIFSQAHKTLDTRSHDYWKFSFHEIGVYDLPAIIDYALEKNKATTLTYCGYSQGTTVFFVLTSTKPEYNSKFSAAHLMAPVVFMRFPMPAIRNLAQRQSEIVDFILANQLYECVPLSPEMRKMTATLCDKRAAGLTTCKHYYLRLGGNTRSQYNEDLIPKVFQFLPASASYGQFWHYSQIINSNGNFTRFDHGPMKNVELYGQASPPMYNLSNVRTNVHFLYGTGDTVAHPKDVHFLMAKLKAVTIGITKINDFNHFDFMYGKDIQKKLNNVILRKMKSLERN